MEKDEAAFGGKKGKGKKEKKKASWKTEGLEEEKTEETAQKA